MGKKRLKMKCKCKNPDCAKEYDSQETSRIHGDVPWLYRFCLAPCFTQVFMKKSDFQFELYDPMENEVIAGPVEAKDREDAAIKLLDTVGYEIRIVEKDDVTGDEKNEQG